MGSIQCDLHAIPDNRRTCLAAAFCTDNAGYSQLTADNRGMTGHASRICDNTAGLFHHRHPVRCSHRSDQNLSWPESIDFCRIQDYSGSS